MHACADVQVSTKGGMSCCNGLGGGSNGASVQTEECLDRTCASLGVRNEGEVSVVQTLVHNDCWLGLRSNREVVSNHSWQKKLLIKIVNELLFLCPPSKYSPTDFSADGDCRWLHQQCIWSKPHNVHLGHRWHQTHLHRETSTTEHLDCFHFLGWFGHLLLFHDTLVKRS